MLKQLSVFVENKPGSLMEVTSRLTEAHVNIRAVASFDTPESISQQRRRVILLNGDLL